MRRRVPTLAVRSLGVQALVVPAMLLSALLVVVGCSTAADSRCRVDGSGPAEELTALREACERALPAIEQVWPQWTGPVHIVRSADPLPAGTAAHVEGTARPGAPAEGDRLVVAPGLTGEVSSAGLDVVLRHELTHVAMRATGTAPIPLWAAEGLAEHVGYASVPDERRHRSAEVTRLRERVKAGTWTGTVPTEDQLHDPGDRADAYTAAWLGIEALIGEHGPAAVTAAMRDPASIGESGLLTTLGETPATMTARWHEELVSRAAPVD